MKSWIVIFVYGGTWDQIDHVHTEAERDALVKQHRDYCLNNGDYQEHEVYVINLENGTFKDYEYATPTEDEQYAAHVAKYGKDA